MMRGRLVIASDIGGLGEIVGDAGLTFPMGDVEQLAACMQRVLDEPDVIQSLGQTARARALKLFHQDRMVAEHLQFYIALQSRD
jgi:glycosyltransferase involved in cell wall biosynthesis